MRCFIYQIAILLFVGSVEIGLSAPKVDMLRQDEARGFLEECSYMQIIEIVDEKAKMIEVTPIKGKETEFRRIMTGINIKKLRSLKEKDNLNLLLVYQKINKTTVHTESIDRDGITTVTKIDINLIKKLAKRAK